MPGACAHAWPVCGQRKRGGAPSAHTFAAAEVPYAVPPALRRPAQKLAALHSRARCGGSLQSMWQGEARRAVLVLSTSTSEDQAPIMAVVVVLVLPAGLLHLALPGHLCLQEGPELALGGGGHAGRLLPAILCERLPPPSLFWLSVSYAWFVMLKFYMQFPAVGRPALLLRISPVAAPKGSRWSRLRRDARVPAGSGHPLRVGVGGGGAGGGRILECTLCCFPPW